MKEQLKVDLKPLFDYSREVERFLKIELQGKVTRKGARLFVEGDKLRVVKLKLEKFLYHHGLNEYRVITKNNSLEVVATREVSKRGPIQTRASASETTPEYFPGLSTFAATRFKTPRYYFGPGRTPVLRRRNRPTRKPKR